MCETGSGDDAPCCMRCRFTNEDDCAIPAGIRERPPPREEPVVTAGSGGETVETVEPEGIGESRETVETVETAAPVWIGGNVETVETE